MRLVLVLVLAGCTADLEPRCLDRAECPTGEACQLGWCVPTRDAEHPAVPRDAAVRVAPNVGQGDADAGPRGEDADAGLVVAEPPHDLEDDDEVVRVEWVEQSRWREGYCMDAFVRADEEEDEPIRWTVLKRVEGTLYRTWGVEVDETTGQVRFWGVGSAKTVAPGAMVAVGYCARLHD